MKRLYLREWRKHRGLTQKELAARMESEPGIELMSYVTVSNIERGAQSPTLEQLYAIAEALDITVAALVTHHPKAEGEVIDLMRRIDSGKRDTVIAMIRAAIGE